MSNVARLTGLIVALTLLTSAPARAITLGQRDDFTSSTQGWGPWTGLATPGPGGASDSYYVLTPDGSGSSGRVIAHNWAQWAGNYLAAGVRSISLSANNLGVTALSMRVAIGDTSSPMQGGTWFVSTVPVPLPPASGWSHLFFSLDCADLTSVQGTASCNQVLSGVASLRILHATTPDARGDSLSTVVGLDDITAANPIPISILPYADEGRQPASAALR